MLFSFLRFRPQLLVAGLLLTSPLAAQTLTNRGTCLTVQPGTALVLPDSLLNQVGSTLTNAGTLQLGRTLRNAGTLTSPGLVSFIGTAPQRLAAGGASLAQLEINNSGPASQNVLLVTDNLTVAQQLRLLNGLVRTRAATTISLPDGAALTGEAPGRYVQGNLRVTRAAVATATDFGHGVTLASGGQALGAVSITRTAGLQTAGLSQGTNMGATTKGIDRIWTVESQQPPTTPISLTLSWLPDDDNGLTSFTAARVWQQPGGASGWQPVGPPANASARSISASSQAVGRFTVSNDANPLPVEMVSFSAVLRGADAWLEWETAVEKNSDYFAVERSTDGRSFAEIGRRAGHGTTVQPHKYQFNEPNVPWNGVAVMYYRLRQVDTDGTVTYSPVRPLRQPLTASLTVQAWPNPFDVQGLQLLVHSQENAPLRITILDALGHELLTQPASVFNGLASVLLPQAGLLPVGVYVLRVQQGGQQQLLKVVRQ